VVAGEFAAGVCVSGRQVIDQTMTLLRTFTDGNGHCPVQFDNRRWLNLKQAIVKPRNLAPVLLSCWGTGGGIYDKLANGVPRHHCARPVWWPNRNMSDFGQFRPAADDSTSSGCVNFVANTELLFVSLRNYGCYS
jgi:hypothetical protein